MRFVEDIEEDKYTKFFLKNDNSNFLQSFEWGQACLKNKKMIPHYVGLIDDNNNILCETLILEKKLIFGFSYMYAPRGFIVDYNDLELIKKFTDSIKKYIKKKKSIYLRIDPYISYQEVDENAKKVLNGHNNYNIFNCFLSLGYKHKGFNLLYESNQPRFTFIIDLKNDMEQIYNNFNKSNKKNIVSANKYGLEVKIGNIKDIKTFYQLISKTAEKDNFKQYSYDYYYNFYKTFSKNNNVKIFLCYIYPQKIIEALYTDLEKSKDSPASIERIKKMLIKYEAIKEERIVACAHIVVIYGNKATALYAGNSNEYNDVYTNPYTYYEKIKYCKECGCNSIDLFGVCGDPLTKYKNLAGIFEYKKNFGGKCIEYMGDFDLVNKKVIYYLLPLLKKIYYIFK